MIDVAADQRDQLVTDLQSQTDRVYEILVLNPNQDGTSQTTDELHRLESVSAIHLVSHGEDGEILPETSVLSQRNIDRYAADIISWQASMTSDADLLIYGCNLAASEDGVILTESLNLLLNADVAASDDATGEAVLGGDWNLEQQVGDIETNVAFSTALQHHWHGILAITATDELPVNSTITDVQETSGENCGSKQAVSVAADGSYVVACSSVNQDGSGWGIFARRFDSDGPSKDRVYPECRCDVSDGHAELLIQRKSHCN